MKKTKTKNNIFKLLIIITFILIAIIDILLIKRIERLEKEINQTDSKCLQYYESALEILK